MPNNKYTDDFKKIIIELLDSGKTVSSLAKEYEIERQNIYIWKKLYSKGGSFKSADLKTDLEKENQKLLKENAELKLDNEILKKQH